MVLLKKIFIKVIIIIKKLFCLIWTIVANDKDILVRRRRKISTTLLKKIVEFLHQYADTSIQKCIEIFQNTHLLQFFCLPN